MEINLIVTVEDYNTIIKGLLELQGKICNPIIQKLIPQVEQQLKEKEKESKSE